MRSRGGGRAVLHSVSQNEAFSSSLQVKWGHTDLSCGPAADEQQLNADTSRRLKNSRQQLRASVSSSFILALNAAVTHLQAALWNGKQAWRKRSTVEPAEPEAALFHILEN